MSWLNHRFDLEFRQTSTGRELRGAVATFLTMAYILVANPAILKEAGVPYDSAVACTALAAGVCCLLMGWFANYPLALASGMGLNAFVAIELTQATGSWQAAMGLVVLDGLLVLALVLLGVREAMVHAIPVDLRRAIGAGIGLFIALIGATNAGFIERTPYAGGLPLQPGSLTEPPAVVALVGLLLTATLLVRQVPGAILLGILGATVVAVGWDAAAGTTHFGAYSPKFSPPSFQAAFQARPWDVLRIGFIPLLLALMMVDFFDTLGTVTALAEQAQLSDDKGRIPRLRQILIVDSLSASIGGLLGVSSVTSYIESAAGVAEGARTGLHTIFVGLMFLAAILLAPLIALVPSVAAAPALILVGFLMCEALTTIEFRHLDVGIPAFLTLLMIPLTCSIAHGIGAGFVTFVLLKLATGRVRDIHPLMAVAATLFAAYFAAGR
ncbi:MAG: NCS2 family permease [Planctomycetaceae bacterium]|nr:NCS2 family permease [Planctomycetaceae bacterium]